MDFRLLFWPAYFVLAAALIWGAVNEISAGKNVKDDMYYAKDLSLVFSNVGSVSKEKGRVTVVYDEFLDYDVDYSKGVVMVGDTGLYPFLRSDNIKVDDKKEAGLVIMNG